MDMQPPVTPKPMPAAATELLLDYTNKLFGIVYINLTGVIDTIVPAAGPWLWALPTQPVTRQFPNASKSADQGWFPNSSNPQAWFLCFNLFCKKHCIHEEDHLEEAQYFLSLCAALWHTSLNYNSTWSNWKALAYERFGGEVEGTLLKLKSIKQANFQGTNEFIEEISAALSQYQDLV
ncbi:hypothetical protein DSO57_1024129 [Entomophthora muscae]|uniref:Uncharacterized protein n=1 Tax=Entomophthora muscae TaxID=34485 RepID=A0ACC2SRL8_9FUNG|nr:hypothetical protein DSO57_1024129 [Entomophthora muscae]